MSNVETPSRIVDDPAGVCMMMMLHARTPADLALVASTARQLLRAAGASVQEPEQAAKVRSARYALLGGKPS